MVIDTSALIAVLMGEPDAARLANAISVGSTRLISAASLVETSIVIESRKGDAGGRELDLLLYRTDVEIIAVDQGQAELARLAWRRYGRGRHPASLNYGDCFSYALAKSRRLPLLFIGNDFAQTDIEPVPLAP